MSIPLLPEFDADGYQIEPSTAVLNQVITAVNAALSEAGLIAALGDSESDVATAVTALAAPVPHALPTTSFSSFEYDASTFFGPLTLTTHTLTANRLYAVPVRFEYEFSLSYVGVYVTTGAAGNLRMGIYGQKANGFPGDLILDGGAVSSATTGVKSRAMSDTILAPGVYFVALISDATATTRGFTVSTGALWGSQGDELYGCHIYASGTYGALPATFPTGGLIIPSSAAPFLYTIRT